jgi:hypothetical protein
MYATGAAVSRSDLLNSLATFAPTAGWTVDYNGAWNITDYWLAIHKGAVYLHYWAPGPLIAPTVINFYAATGYNGSAAPNAQPNTSAQTLITPGAGPYTAYYFFASAGANYLHLVLQCAAGVFQHLHGGALDPVGGAAPLIYATCSAWQNIPGGGGTSSSYDTGSSGNCMPFTSLTSVPYPFQVYCTVDGVSRWFASSSASPARAIGCLQLASRVHNAIVREPNTFNQLVPFIPLSVYLERLAGNIWSYVGDVLDTRLMNIQNNAPLDEIVIGPDTWKVFPMIAKTPPATWNTAGGPCSSGPYALAFRKNA